MVVKSAHSSFSLIAMRDYGLSPKTVQEIQREFRARKRAGYPLPFTSLFIKFGVLDHGQIATILMRREVMARRCRECFQKTYLLPHERSHEIQCEHCFGPLWSGRIDDESRRLQKLVEISKDAKRQQSPKLYVQAARIAMELNRLMEARAYLRAALVLEAGFKPAQSLIEEYLPHFYPVPIREQSQYRYSA